MRDVCMSRKTKTAVVFISVTVEYLYRNGESAYELYTAVFTKGENVDLTKRAVKPLPLGMGI